jgi:hypothetical protein
MTQYKIKAPVGSIVTPKEIMTEAEIRAFVPQLVQDPEQHETWVEKAAKDPIEEVIEWLTNASFSVEKIES